MNHLALLNHRMEKYDLVCGSNDYFIKEGNRNANPVMCKLTVPPFSGFLRLKKNHNHNHNHNHHRHLLFSWFAINKTSFEGAEAREPMQKVIPFLITKSSFDLRQSDFRHLCRQFRTFCKVCLDESFCTIRGELLAFLLRQPGLLHTWRREGCWRGLGNLQVRRPPLVGLGNWSSWSSW